MEIRSVRFQAFKSLYDVRVEMAHLTVLTGANGSGKSNFVDALSFLSDVYAHGLEFAVSRAGGYENIAHRRTRRAKRPISVTVEVAISAAELADPENFAFSPRGRTRRSGARQLRGIYFLHSFAFKATGSSIAADFEVVEDVIRILDSDRREVLRVFRGDEGRVVAESTPAKGSEDETIRDALSPFGDPEYESFINRRPLQRTSLILDQLRYASLLFNVTRTLSRIRVFQLSPYQCRLPGVPTPNAALERHGENLPGAAQYLSRTNPKAWRRVERAMRAILPDLTGIEIRHSDDRRLVLQFRERGVGRAWSAGEVSDGTIQALGLFVALFDPRNPMVIIEEPENSVHPWILRRFLGLCAESEAKQVFLTSHSPIVMDYVEPALVRLAFVKDGRTHVSRLLDLDPDIARVILSGDIGLFQAYDSGAFSESVPRGIGSVPLLEDD